MAQITASVVVAVVAGMVPLAAQTSLSIYGDGRVVVDGVTVAVVDTGIAQVADLSGRIVGGVDFSGGSNPYNDEFGHGGAVRGAPPGDG